MQDIELELPDVPNIKDLYKKCRLVDKAEKYEKERQYIGCIKNSPYMKKKILLEIFKEKRINTEKQIEYEQECEYDDLEL